MHVYTGILLFSLKSLYLFTRLLQVAINSCSICSISTIRDTKSLNSADMPLSNKEANSVSLAYLYTDCQLQFTSYTLNTISLV